MLSLMEAFPDSAFNGTAGANGVCNPAGTFPADVACAATNGSVIPALVPDFISKSGSGTGQYPVVGFFEGGLDLTDIGPPSWSSGQLCHPG